MCVCVQKIDRKALDGYVERSRRFFDQPALAMHARALERTQAPEGMELKADAKPRVVEVPAEAVEGSEHSSGEDEDPEYYWSD